MSAVGKDGGILLYYLTCTVSFLCLLSRSECTSVVIGKLPPIIGTSFDSSSAIGLLYLAFSLIVMFEKLNGCDLAELSYRFG